MIDLPVGTMVEVYRTKIVSEIAVVECSNPLILRRATAFERFKCFFRHKRIKSGEIAAAVEAIDAIDKAKERTPL